MFIAVDEDFPEHPKTLRLCASLQFEHAWSYLVKLWRWAMRYAKDGDLSRFEPIEIEFAVGWRGDEGRFWAAAVKAGFIDSDANGQRLHDWMDHNGKWVLKVEGDRRRAQDRRMKSNGVAAPSSTAESEDRPKTVREPSEDRLGSQLGGKGEERSGSDPVLNPNPELVPPVAVPPATVLLSRDRPVYRPPQVGAITAPFLRVYDAYRNKTGKQRAAEEWHVQAALHSGGEEGLAKDVLAAWHWQRDTHPYNAPEIRFVHKLENYLSGRMWLDDRPANAPPKPKPTGPQPAYYQPYRGDAPKKAADSPFAALAEGMTLT